MASDEQMVCPNCGEPAGPCECSWEQIAGAAIAQRDALAAPDVNDDFLDVDLEQAMEGFEPD